VFNNLAVASAATATEAVLHHLTRGRKLIHDFSVHRSTDDPIIFLGPQLEDPGPSVLMKLLANDGTRELKRTISRIDTLPQAEDF